MSETQIMTIYGRTPPCSVYRRIEDRRNEAIALKARSEESASYISYEDSDNEEETLTRVQTILTTSYNIVDYVRSRELLLKTVRKVHPNFGSRHILTHEMFKETPIELGNIDKIFCSQWLSDRKVVFGTKCNKLMVYDVVTRSSDQISSLLSRRHTSEVDQHQNSIHSVQLNPSRTLLATAAQNTCDISIYSLPSLDPVCVGENAHKDRIFDMCWLDDEYLVSGSRDSTVSLWKVTPDMTKSSHVLYPHISAMSVKYCKNSQKVRALCFNKPRKELAALSSNGYIHIWNADTFKQISSKKLALNQHVCIAVQDTGELYAIGLSSYVLLLECKTLQIVKKLTTSYLRSIRSLSFRGDILTIGTGSGLLMFYDLRTGKFLESHIKSCSNVIIQARYGHVYPENIHLLNSDDGSVIIYSTHNGIALYTHDGPAIYTHCYDFSGTRLFTAGGPLKGNSAGYYASLWQ